MNIITSHFDNLFSLINFVDLSFEWYNKHTIIFYNHKNKNPGLKISSYSNLETGLNPV